MEQTSSHSPDSNRTRRKGQALVEFALTLPILLLLVFGIVEFGRAFQAWVTIQNAARAAARVASIGSVNYDLFVPDDTLPENKDAEGKLLPQDLRVQNTIVPCEVDEDLRGTKGDINGTEVYEGGKESFFATWYDGTDCDPANEDHQQFRKDILRIVSVMNEAREASSSLMVEANKFQGLDAVGVRDLLYDTWTTPRPGNHDQSRYFDVMVCSSRFFLDSFSDPIAERFNLSRFVTVRNERDKAEIGNVLAKEDYPFPVCMLNEIPPTTMPDGTVRTDQLTNAGARWLDAGGPGERVTISIAFNHPLVTPIFNQQYIFMEARRSIVNESFRAPRAVGAFQRSLPPGDELPPLPPTATPTETEEPPPTPTNTDTATQTYTPSPEPFECDKITVEWQSTPFVSDTFFMVIRNTNQQPVELTRTKLEWNPLNDFKSMYLQTMSLDDQTYWAGPNGPIPAAQQPQTVIDTRSNPTFYDVYRVVAGSGNGSARWKGYFRNGPTNLAAYYQLWDFDAVFEFVSTDGTGDVCSIVLVKPERPEPTITLTPSAGPPPTNTPNCATLQQLSLSFIGFQTRGVVVFEVNNSSTRPTSFIGFSLVWPDATHPDIRLAANFYRLALVTVGGDGPTDTATVPVWESANDTTDSVGNKKTTIPYDFGTVSGNAAEGRWLGAATINPGITRIYFDFDGTGLIGRLSDAPYNHRSWHYNQPRFNIGCQSGGGGGGGGGGQNGDIGIPLPSPAPTSIPAPTKTPGPTSPPTATTKPPTAGPTSPPTATTKPPTAGPTRTPAPPTKTPTKAPATLRPTNTPFGQPPQTPGSGGE